MKEHLKMSDVFEGVVIAKHIDGECLQEISFGESCGNCWSIEDDSYWIAVTKDHAEYAAHAINSHDELVEMVKYLVLSMEQTREWVANESKSDTSIAQLHMIDFAISKAKGGAA